MSKCPASLLVLAVLLPGGLLAQQDALTIGSSNASSPGTVDIPVYLRDVSGTALGRDKAAGLRIQGISFQVSFPAASVSSVTAQRAGVLGSLTPLFEATQSTASTIGYLASFQESTDLVPLTLNASGYGDRVGTLRFSIPAGLPAGAKIVLTPSSGTTSLVSNQAGTTVESASTPVPQLTTTPGTIAIGTFWGDANLDGTIDVFDIVILASYIVGNVSPGQAPFLGTSLAMNLNPALGSTVDVLDLVILAGEVVGNVPSLPVP